MADEHKADPKEEPRNTSSVVRLIKQHENTILDRWQQAALENIPSAKNQSQMELVNHLQVLLADIVYALNQLNASHPPCNINELELDGHPSAVHGRERAGLKGYTAGQLMHEYILLRHVITKFLCEQGIDDVHQIDALSSVIEFSSLSAVNEFISSIQQVQEKLMATLVHDVRSPLSVAHNAVGLLSLNNVSEDIKHKAIAIASKNLKRASDMLEDLLDTVTLDAGYGLAMRFEHVDINNTIRAICQEAKHVYDIPFASELPDHPVMGHFDLALIVRTTENLIANAIKFSDWRNPVTVSLEDQEEYVVLRVHNTGEPIPEGDLDEIFDFFSSTGYDGARGTKGWGLGLALIKAVTEQHGGEVILESSREHGTTVGMSLRKYYRTEGEEISVLI